MKHRASVRVAMWASALPDGTGDRISFDEKVCTYMFARWFRFERANKTFKFC